MTDDRQSDKQNEGAIDVGFHDALQNAKTQENIYNPAETPRPGEAEASQVEGTLAPEDRGAFREATKTTGPGPGGY
jgi:hypothetical protein